MQLSVLQVCISQTKEKEKAASLEMCLEELPTAGKWSVETNGKRERFTVELSLGNSWRVVSW